MCNASNHPPSCRCGWGQGYNSHFHSGDSYTPLALAEPIRSGKRYDSYLNPNAICKYCNEQVYFFQCQNGGRVFFNDVGKPWEKHGCMIDDTDKLKPALAPIVTRNFDNSEYVPFQIVQIKPYKDDRTYSVIKGSINNKIKYNHFLIKTDLLTSSQIDYDTMCMMRRVSKGKNVCVNYLDRDGNPTAILFQKYYEQPKPNKANKPKNTQGRYKNKKTKVNTEHSNINS